MSGTLTPPLLPVLLIPQLIQMTHRLPKLRFLHVPTRYAILYRFVNALRGDSYPQATSYSTSFTNGNVLMSYYVSFANHSDWGLKRPQNLPITYSLSIFLKCARRAFLV